MKWIVVVVVIVLCADAVITYRHARAHVADCAAHVQRVAPEAWRGGVPPPTTARLPKDCP